jgi:hypothetical protein
MSAPLLLNSSNGRTVGPSGRNRNQSLTGSNRPKADGDGSKLISR